MHQRFKASSRVWGARRRRGFIIVFGMRNIISNDAGPPLETVCPRCRMQAALLPKTYRRWFSLFWIPVFPISGAKKFCQCSVCKAQFGMTLDQLRSRLSAAEAGQNQQAIGLYNSLRNSPNNSITLNELMLMYAQMKEYDQAISAARDFPDALHNSEQCMSTLGRIFLAKNDPKQAAEWFDHALNRNPSLGEAQYHKAIALMTLTPPEVDKAIAAARAARNSGYPNSDALLRDIEGHARGDAAQGLPAQA